MIANKIYDAVTRLDDPRAAVAELSADELAALNDLLTRLPCTGFPVLMAALVDEEIQSRWLKHQEQDPS